MPRPDWRDRLRAEHGRNVISFVGDTPVGLVGGRRTEHDVVELVSMWVPTGQRGRGIGDALVRDVVALAGPAPVHL